MPYQLPGGDGGGSSWFSGLGGMNPATWTLGGDQPIGGLGAGMLGLGALGTLGGAVSSWMQQQRQNQLFKQAQDPNYWQKFYTPANDAYIQNLQRMVNQGLALRGIQGGGEANLAVARAMSENEFQRQQQAQQQA